MSQLKVNALVSYSGNTVTLGTSGDTINVASGVTFNTASATVTLPSTINATTINVTTLVLAAGAVGTPSLTTSGDTNTGIFFPAADTIGFAEGGSEAMRINSSGQVLVGLTTNTALSQFQTYRSLGIHFAAGGNFTTTEFGDGATGAFTTITMTFKFQNGNVGSSIVEVQMTGFSSVYLDHVVGRYGGQGVVVMRNNASAGTTVAYTNDGLVDSVMTHTITTSVTHPVIKYKVTCGGIGGVIQIAPTITFA